MTKDIDVIMANYNHANTIGVAVEAILSQSYKPNKILIIDDASTDNSLEVLYQLQNQNSNIEVIKNELNLGPTRCYEMGLQKIQSQFFYLAAADDIIMPKFFEYSINALEKFPQVAFSICEVLVTDLDSGKKSIRPIIRPKTRNNLINPELAQTEFLSNENWILTGTAIFRKKYISDYILNESLGPFSDSFIAKQLVFKYGCVFLPYVGLNWRIDNSGYSRLLYSSVNYYKEKKKLLEKAILSSSVFPSWYWLKYEKRLDFNAIRIVLNSKEINLAMCENLMSKIEYSIFVRLKRFPKFNKTVILGFAFFRLRPFSMLRYILNLMNSQKILHGH